MLIAPQHETTGTITRQGWWCLALVVVLGSAVLAIPRWGHHTPDSKHYVALAECLCGERDSCALVAPYAYRLVSASVACLIPSPNFDFAFALQSFLWSASSVVLALVLARRAGSTRGELATGAVLMLVSFPTLNYSSGVLSDAAGLFFFVLGLFLIQSQRWWAAAITAGVAVLARESNLILIAVAISVATYSSTASVWKRWVGAICCGIVPLGALWSARAAFGPIPSAELSISFQRLSTNLTRPISWVTVILTIGPLLLLAAARRRLVWQRFKSYAQPDRALYLSALLGVCATFLVGLFGAFMSGRFLWPLYPVLLPFVSAGLRATSFERLATRVVYWGRESGKQDP